MDIKRENLIGFFRTLGPGILFASTCVGVSHLVQSTRAGADYGFTLLLAIILANVLKYPFFEFASRYTNATGKSILDGYLKIGRWTLYGFLIMTLLTMFVVTAAVTFVTAGLLGNLFPQVNWDTGQWNLLVLGVCMGILLIGRFGALDFLLKIVASVLVISTLIAFFSALSQGPQSAAPLFTSSAFDTAGLLFLVALMGWMPTAVDMSVWTSLWTEARIMQTKFHPSLKQTLVDFNLGYWVSAGLAILFLGMGALVIYGSGTELSDNSTVFAEQLIQMYTASIGAWSYWVIAVAAFCTMFSTSITVIDGYCRAMARIFKLLFFKGASDSRKIYNIWSLILVAGTFAVVSKFVGSLRELVDLATVLSFIVAPFAAYLNFKAVLLLGRDGGPVPPRWLKLLAYAGFIFLGGFIIFYFWVLTQ